MPDVWNVVRAEVDAREADGQFTLTGSATPSDDVTRHTGAMRIARVRMAPMSMFDSHDSAGGVSLGAVLRGERPLSAGGLVGLWDIAEMLCRGGWPPNLRRNVEHANRDPLRAMAAADLPGEPARDPVKLAALLRALARAGGTYTTNTALISDVTGTGEALGPRTLAVYMDALARLWVVVDQ